MCGTTTRIWSPRWPPPAEAELAAGHRSNARTLLNEAHEAAADGPILPAARQRRCGSPRAGSAAVPCWTRPGTSSTCSLEELTDRERSILRALPGPLTLRQIGAELFLSLNTVKGYTKSLYRKLGVSGREEAVCRARAVGLL